MCIRDRYWDNVPFVEEFQKYISLPLRISNDANCAALGEVRAGAAEGCDSAVLLTPVSYTHLWAAPAGSRQSAGAPARRRRGPRKA